MHKGIKLTLMIGPAVPVPVPKIVIDALRSVEITIPTQGPTVCQLAFALGKRAPLPTLSPVSGGIQIPIIRVMVLVTLNGTPNVLFDGVMTNHEIQPGSGAGEATASITAEDLTRVMDYVEFNGLPYPAMPPAARVLLMLANYTVFGIAPLVVPPIFNDVPLPTNRIPAQSGTHLHYIKRLAKEVGHVFYIEPGPAPGANIAYWGPPIKVGVPQPALNTNMDARTNVESLSFNFDSQSATVPVLFIHNELTKVPIPIPIPDVSLLNPPLGLIPPIPLKFGFLNGTAKLPPLRAAAIGLTAASEASDAVTASGTLDVLRYGRVLKARQLVGVRGAGAAFNGLYYVESVTHSIERGKYTQSFNLSRNGLLSTVPRVIP